MRASRRARLGALGILSTLAIALCGCVPWSVPDDANVTPTARPTVTLKSDPVDPQQLTASEAEYLENVRVSGRTSRVVSRATKTQLLIAGWQACAELKRGVILSEVSVVEGERRQGEAGYPDSAIIARSADLYLCS